MTALEALTINYAPRLTDAGITGLHDDMVKLIVPKKSYQTLHNSETMVLRLNGVSIKDQLRRKIDYLH
jgi:hypothetical protein